MKPRDQQRKEDERELPTTPPKDDHDSKAPPADAAKPPGLKYVFKIAPADPKRNGLDFEDVADK
jgi:hypothetical protein